MRASGISKSSGREELILIQVIFTYICSKHRLKCCEHALTETDTFEVVRCAIVTVSANERRHSSVRSSLFKSVTNSDIASYLKMHSNICERATVTAVQSGGADATTYFENRPIKHMLYLLTEAVTWNGLLQVDLMKNSISRNREKKLSIRLVTTIPLAKLTRSDKIIDVLAHSGPELLKGNFC